LIGISVAPAPVDAIADGVGVVVDEVPARRERGVREIRRAGVDPIRRAVRLVGNAGIEERDGDAGGARRGRDAELHGPHGPGLERARRGRDAGAVHDPVGPRARDARVMGEQRAGGAGIGVGGEAGEHQAGARRPPGDRAAELGDRRGRAGDVAARRQDQLTGRDRAPRSRRLRPGRQRG
jgi:hypothetical protein